MPSRPAKPFYNVEGCFLQAPPIQVELLLIRAFNQEQGGKVDARSFGGTRLPKIDHLHISATISMSGEFAD